MPTKTNTFTFTLPVQILHTTTDFSLARTKSQSNPQTTVEINHQEVTFTSALTEQDIHKNKLFIATIAIINGRGHALSLAPYCQNTRHAKTE